MCSSSFAHQVASSREILVSSRTYTQAVAQNNVVCVMLFAYAYTKNLISGKVVVLHIKLVVVECAVDLIVP